MRACLFVAMALVAGCTQTRYVDKIIEVPVEVPIACRVKVPERLVYPLDRLPAGETHGAVILAMDEELVEREAMEDRLRNLLDTCMSIGEQHGRS